MTKWLSKRFGAMTPMALVATMALAAAFSIALAACNSDKKGGTTGPNPDPDPDPVDTLYDTARTYMRALTLRSLDTTSNDSLLSYPLLVRLSATADSLGADILAGAGTDGANLRVYTGDGTTALSHEIERWSASEAAIWVRVPVVRLKEANTLRLYWGDSVPAAATGAVFDTANGFAAVFHLAEAAGDTIRDVTQNAFKGVPVIGATVGSAVPADVAGPVGLAKAFGGNVDDTPEGAQTGGAYRVETASGGSTYNAFDYQGNDAEFTVSVWVNYAAYPPGFTRRRGIITKADHGDGQLDDNDPSAQWFMRPNIEARVLHFQRVAQQNYSTQPYSIADGTGPIAGVLGNWNYVTYSAKGTAADNALRLYNASGSTFRNIADEPGVHRDVNVFIGGFAAASGIGAEKSGGTHFLNGMVDEVRISRTARSDAWHNADYVTQRPGSDALVLGGRDSTLHITHVP
jgi:hypothetical protein